ncbi:hypothetical protein J4733_00710 [Klebsiella pneumoniae]|uniref:Uncharacterized protein n=1 Tax=Klebsiella pneumoniae TaxID=573 RepID=A0A939NS39_KLEPN|nr:hypothetical protein [Klebsiella pneumoniae]
MLDGARAYPLRFPISNGYPTPQARASAAGYQTPFRCAGWRLRLIRPTVTQL